MASNASTPDTPRAPRRRSAKTAATPARRTFVLDTSVLLSDPRAMLRFAEHEVVLPVVVVTELEGKRHHPELGYFARQALRLLDGCVAQLREVQDAKAALKMLPAADLRAALEFRRRALGGEPA